MNKILYYFLAVSFFICHLGCNQVIDKDVLKVDTSKPEDIKVGISLSYENKEKGLGEIDYLKNVGADYAFLVIAVETVKDGEKQIEKCKDLLKQNIDSLILRTEEKETAREIINLAHEKGVKVILYNQYVDYSTPDYYVTFNWEQAGKMQANSIIKKMPKGKFIWLKSRNKKQFAQDLFIKGQEKAIEPFVSGGDIEIVYSAFLYNEDEEEGYVYIKDAINKIGNNFQGIMVASDKAIDGVIKALEEAKMEEQVLITGQGGDISACQRILNKKQLSTVYTPLDKLAKLTMEVARATAKGKDPKEELDSKSGIWKRFNNNFIEIDTFLVNVLEIDKDNILDTIIINGYHSINQVYKDIPSDEWPKLKNIY